MADRVREQLLGYLLGALDGSEQKQIEERLARDPRLRKELALVRIEIQPLRAARPRFDLPFGLAARTCEYVFARADGHTEPLADVPAAARSVPSVRESTSAAPSSKWRLADLSVAAAIIAAAALLVFPAIANSRFSTRILDCQNNLRQIGIGLAQYSQHNQGYFPAVPAQGPLAGAGIYLPVLMQGTYIDDGRWGICPSSSEQRAQGITIDQLLSAHGRELERLQRDMGGDYGYCMGHYRNGCYCGTRNRGRSYFAIMADAPLPDSPVSGSLNHGLNGQNVMFEDGRVVFLTVTQTVGYNDNFYLNDLGRVSAGRHRDDSVIGFSAAVPVELPSALNVRRASWR